MEYFNYQKNILYAESIPMHQIANEFNTPCYVYSKNKILENWHTFNKNFDNTSNRIFYAVKANSNIHILKLLSALGAGFDTVSAGEIDRVITAGGAPANIIYSGVGKTAAEITKALILEIYYLSIESEQELYRVEEIAKNLNKIARISFRVNPNINAASHPLISTGMQQHKFGIHEQLAIKLYQYAIQSPYLKVMGISCHIGSQITKLEPFLQAIDKIISITHKLQQLNIHLEFINLGGGLGIGYHNEQPPSVLEYTQAILTKVKPLKINMHIEPGRAIIANAGLILTKIEYIKANESKNFAIVDCAMNDLLRPALYQGWHEVMPVLKNSSTPVKPYDIVGPICETSDYLAQNRQLALGQGDLLVIKNTGAYGFAMSSNYNTRPRCPEVLVDQANIKLIRKRETFAQLIQNEL